VAASWALHWWGIGALLQLVWRRDVRSEDWEKANFNGKWLGDRRAGRAEWVKSSPPVIAKWRRL
jgi:hypothetical protein